jgi:tetratricopeptide (TPR) repeat protein
MRAIALALALLLLALPAHAQSEPERYAACMEKARTKPKEGLAEAEAWLARSASDAGRHCRAAALIGLGRTEEGVAGLTELGQELAGKDPGLAGELYRQAAAAELDAGRTQAALVLQSKGLELAPDSVELLIDRAIAEATTQDYAKALDDLGRAHGLAPRRADILVLTASAWRLEDRPERAEAPLAEALSLEPDNPDGLLERGMLKRMRGDLAGARADWERVEQVAKGSPAAKTAAANLALLDKPQAP